MTPYLRSFLIGAGVAIIVEPVLLFGVATATAQPAPDVLDLSACPPCPPCAAPLAADAQAKIDAARAAIKAANAPAAK